MRKVFSIVTDAIVMMAVVFAVVCSFGASIYVESVHDYNMAAISTFNGGDEVAAYLDDNLKVSCVYREGLYTWELTDVDEEELVAFINQRKRTGSFSHVVPGPDDHALRGRRFLAGVYDTATLGGG